MATINNLQEAAATSLETATFNDTAEMGIKLATGDDFSAFTSSTHDIDLSTNSDSDNVVLTGTANLNVTADSDDNVIIANDGDNTIDAGAGNDGVSTGDGDDTVTMGEGDDYVQVNGSGLKTIDGGAGNDSFIIKLDDNEEQASDVTFTSLNRGDSLRVTVADNNGDGMLSMDDVDVTASENGSLTFNLNDGSSFTLDGVTFDTELNYALTDNLDGTWDVDIT